MVIRAARMALALLTVLPAVAAAQDYDFSVPEFRCTVKVNLDRSLDIAYDILFHGTPGHSSVDIVDIGFPSDDFRADQVEAWIDGEPVKRIYVSTYIDDGVEIHLERNAVRPGTEGRLTVQGTCRDRVFLDTEEDDYASMEFTPTWFDGSLLSGSSAFTLTVVFPEGAEPALVRHHGRAFTDSGVDAYGRVYYVWTETRRVDGPYRVGVSFPADLVDGPLTERPREPLISPEAARMLIVFGSLFLFFALIVFAMVRAVIRANRRKEQYLPPKLGLQGTGIRRGLTAPMAALLLEERLDRVLQLILFGLLKKGVLALREDRLEKTGSTEGLRTYETTLMGLIPDGKPEDFRKMFQDMIADLGKKMDGFSLEDTRKYYRSIIADAWRMVREEEDAGKAGRLLGDRLQWLLVDERFAKNVRELPEDRSVDLPVYLWAMMSGRGAPVSGGKGGISLSQACSQLAGALETTAGNAVTGISKLSAEVTALTNPVPVSTSSYHSSGSGCACACACAGCACACAGGGR